VRPLNTLGLFVVVAATGACARGAAPAASTMSTASASAEERAERPARRQRDVITKEELSAPSVRSRSVFEVVQSLRPHFLNTRGAHSIPYTNADGTEAEKARQKGSDPEAGLVHASIDGGRVVSLEELKGIHANSVIEIRYLSPAAAMQKFGGAAREGPVILVLTM
jgi:hypothetical protein